MKKLLAALLLAPALAAAQSDTSWLAHARNNAGGRIVLLTVRGNCADGQLAMYTTQRDGANMQWGCYIVTDLHIIVRFASGESAAYDFAGWTLNPNVGNRRGTF